MRISDWSSDVCSSDLRIQGSPGDYLRDRTPARGFGQGVQGETQGTLLAQRRAADLSAPSKPPRPGLPLPISGKEASEDGQSYSMVNQVEDIIDVKTSPPTQSGRGARGPHTDRPENKCTRGPAAAVASRHGTEFAVQS